MTTIKKTYHTYTELITNYDEVSKTIKVGERVDFYVGDKLIFTLFGLSRERILDEKCK